MPIGGWTFLSVLNVGEGEEKIQLLDPLIKSLKLSWYGVVESVLLGFSWCFCTKIIVDVEKIMMNKQGLQFSRYFFKNSHMPDFVGLLFILIEKSAKTYLDFLIN